MKDITSSSAGITILELDETLNAAFGGAAGETISMRAALAAKRGSVGGCMMCGFLSLAVQRAHCRKVLDGVPMPDFDGIRAAVWLLLLALAIAGLFWMPTAWALFHFVLR